MPATAVGMVDLSVFPAFSIFPLILNELASENEN